VTLVERIRQRVAATPIRAEAVAAAVPVTFSAGVGQVEPGDASIEAAMRRADQRLYQAKQQGRNRVVGASHPGDSMPKPDSGLHS